MKNGGQLNYCKDHFVGRCARSPCKFSHLLSLDCLSDGEKYRYGKWSQKVKAQKRPNTPYKKNSQALVAVKQKKKQELANPSEETTRRLEQQIQQMQHQLELMSVKNEYESKMKDLKNGGELDLLRQKIDHVQETGKLTTELRVAQATQVSASPTIVHTGYPHPYAAYGHPFVLGSTFVPFSYYGTLLSWTSSSSMSLLYSGAPHGFTAASFHSSCDNRGRTLTVVMANGYIFGGYNPSSWNGSVGYQGGAGSFLFTLTNQFGLPPTCYHWKGSHGPYSYAGHNPTFGSGHDLHIHNVCHTNTDSYSNFPSCYSDTTGRGVITFAGSKNFVVTQLEVFLCL